MARIPDAVIERLKAEVALERLVVSKGIELKHQGKDRLGVCPFHEDESPSLIVTPTKNLFHCMGCGAAGSVIDWVMLSEGVSFRHAAELLINEFMPASTTRKAAKKSTVPKIQSSFEPESADHELSRQVIDYYHHKLKESPNALAYLEKRGLVHGEVIDTFKLGYADRTLGYRLPYTNRKEGAELRGRLKRLGFIRESGHEHLTGSLVIPIFDEDGNVAQAYGRKINDIRLRKGTPMHLYLAGEHKAVWNLAALKASQEIILCESLIDALTFWVNGFRNVTCSYGIQGFLPCHLAAFEQYGIKRILIAYDRDEPGNKAADKLAAELIAKGYECFRIQFPKGMDANGYACCMKPADKALDLLIRKAEWQGGKLAVDGCQLAVNDDGDDQKKLQGTDRLAESSGTGSTDLRSDQDIPQGRELCLGGSGSAVRRVNTLQHSRGTIQATSEGVSTVSVDSERQLGGITDTVDRRREAQLREPRSTAGSGGSNQRGGSTPERSDQQLEKLTTANSQLTTSSPVPALPRSDIKAVIKGEDVFISRGERTYRVRSLEQNLSKNVLKVNLFVFVGDDYYVDVLNLYSGFHRNGFAKRAANELGLKETTIEKDLGKVLLKIEELQDAKIQEALMPEPDGPELSDKERAEALALLRDPRLMERILDDFETSGVVGERTNKLVGYLVAVSRKLPKPLGAMIQSSTASGKTTTMDAILSFVPEEDLVKYSAITGQALYYKGENDLRHKIIAIVEEEGAEKASYPLKLLLSEGELIIASTGKNQTTGQHATQDYHVKGPVAVFVTTTAVETDEEFQNRCLVLTVDESRQQTRAIHLIQRHGHTLEGLKKQRKKSHLVDVHRNAQRLLRPLHVVNPYAPELTFLDVKTRMRRDQEKYLNLIDAITFLHQVQREVHSFEDGGEIIEYIEVTFDDIAMANSLANEVLGRSLDELPPQTRKLLRLVHEMVTGICESETLDLVDVRFTRRDVREYTQWGNTQLKVHLRRLEDMEYLLVHRGGRGQSFVYELLYNGEGVDQRSFLMGLLDVERLKTKYNYPAKKSGVKDEKAGLSRRQNGPMSGPSRPSQTNDKANTINTLVAGCSQLSEKHALREAYPAAAERIVPG